MEQQTQDSKLLLAYWKCRGRVQPVRYLLEYLALPYEEKIYTLDDYEAWFAKDKYTSPAKYPNLPYLKDGERIITETEAILQYLCRKANRRDLLGKNEDDVIDVCTSRWFIQDLIQKAGELAYTEDFEKVMDENFTNEIFPRLQTLSKNLGDKEFLNGYLTYADFILYEIFELLLTMKPESFDKYENLKAFHKRFQEQKFMKDYMTSERFIRRPFYGYAFWNPQE